MAKAPLTNGRSDAAIFLAHFGVFLFVVLAASWLRHITLQPDAILQGYLQIVSGLLAFVFAAVTLVRFQGTQDRISLILGAGFLLSGCLSAFPLGAHRLVAWPHGFGASPSRGASRRTFPPAFAPSAPGNCWRSADRHRADLRVGGNASRLASGSLSASRRLFPQSGAVAARRDFPREPRLVPPPLVR